jgi:hypothetical protein
MLTRDATHKQGSTSSQLSRVSRGVSGLSAGHCDGDWARHRGVRYASITDVTFPAPPAD